MRIIGVLLTLAAIGLVAQSPSAQGQEHIAGDLERFTGMLDQCLTELKAKIPNPTDTVAVNRLLSSNELDAPLVRYVVLHEATPKGLADFAQQGMEQADLIEKLLADPALMQQMLVADGAAAGKSIPAQYGRAMQIYTEIQKTNPKAGTGVLQRLALAIALEHAVPLPQGNPQTQPDAPKTVDPLKRYQSYEKAYLDGELDPAFNTLGTWELRFVVDGNEPDWTRAWGREMIRNYRPDHVYTSNHGWRYVGLVKSNVLYGSERVKFDRPELQNYQNILMNGGICGRRAFFGRFILRSFGIPTIARPSRGHGALAHWTPNGWVVNLGPRWGSGWTNTLYRSDRDFLKSSQARNNREAYLQVKRAQWIGDAMGEKRAYGGNADKAPFWNGLSLRTQERIIQESKSVELAPLGEDLAEADEPTVAPKIIDLPVTDEDRKIVHEEDGTIRVPAAAYVQSDGKRDVAVMKSFAGGLQVYLPNFGRKGVNVMRGGGWKSDADGCMSGRRMRSSGLGSYDNWGFRVAVTAVGNDDPQDLTLDCGNGIVMEFVYIKPGTFVMGGEREAESKFDCIEVPKHEVAITRGFYLGKYEVTRAQFDAVTGSGGDNTKDLTLPQGSVSIGNAEWFCKTLAGKTGRAVRLPTEAEWEYASRAGKSTRWFFGDDPTTLGEYAWFGANAGGKSHPVGQKKPNPWGLYDMYGNVWERVSDSYDKNYYANSPKEDPVGPIQGEASRLEYPISTPHAGKYALTARVVTMNYDQTLNAIANEDSSTITIPMPFTAGTWQDTEPVVIHLKQGENILKFCRTNAPQYGIAVKSFTLKPLK